MKEIGDIVRAYGAKPDGRFALATLVRTRGSSYRRCGARMLIGADGSRVGSLSGGCLEDEVVDQAQAVLRSGEPVLMTFDTRRRFGCNGALDIFVEIASPSFLAALASHYHARRPISVATTPLVGGSTRALGIGEESDPRDFVQTLTPDLQLLSFGDGPDGKAVSGMASALGWSVQILESASELNGSYDEWTAAIVKTHNYGRDFAALRALLPMNLFYVGLLGPRARREQLLADLLDTGLAAGPNLFAPAGLDVGGDSPEAVALSIIAEIQSAFTGGSGASLRTRKRPIHSLQSELAAAAA